jgi:hypothetical protein
MEKNRETGREVEKTFLMLPPSEREAVISHGVAIRLSDLRKRLFLAESKIRHFEETYKTSLSQLETLGLPDEADCLMHEDYVMWQHWAGVVKKTKEDIVLLEKIAEHGLLLGESSNAGH